MAHSGVSLRAAPCDVPFGTPRSPCSRSLDCIHSERPPAALGGGAMIGFAPFGRWPLRRDVVGMAHSGVSLRAGSAAHRILSDRLPVPSV